MPSCSAGSTCLHYAADVGCVHSAQQLVAFERKLLHSTDAFGRTSVIIAAQRGHTEMILYLLDQGADITVRDKVHKGQPSGACYQHMFVFVSTLLQVNATRFTSQEGQPCTGQCWVTLVVTTDEHTAH